MTKYVCGFLFNPEYTHVALIRKLKAAWQKGKLNGIGDKVEEYVETIYHAMSREFEEESGVHIWYDDWTHLCQMTGNDWPVGFFYSVNDVFSCVSKEDE